MNHIHNHFPHKTFRLILITGILSLPSLVSILLIYILLGANLFDFIPSRIPEFNDEVGYWRQIDTFRQMGWSGGYYTVQELSAPASFSHFGPHGPAFIMIYGYIARLVGWYPYSSVLFRLMSNLRANSFSIAHPAYQVRGHSLGIGDGFKHGNVAREIGFVDAAKRSQK